MTHTRKEAAASVHEMHGAFAPGQRRKGGMVMAYAIGSDDHVAGAAGGRSRRRSREQVRRPRTVRFALTQAEYDELSAGARLAGLACGAYSAEAALAVARGAVMLPQVPLQDTLHTLDRIATGLRRIGVNLNQAVARLNTTGQSSADLPAYAAECIRRAARAETVAEDLRTTFRTAFRDPAPHGPQGGTGPAGPPAHPR
jgi:hypothetical protein